MMYKFGRKAFRHTYFLPIVGQTRLALEPKHFVFGQFSIRIHSIFMVYAADNFRLSACVISFSLFYPLPQDSPKTHETQAEAACIRLHLLTFHRDSVCFSPARPEQCVCLYFSVFVVVLVKEIVIRILLYMQFLYTLIYRVLHFFQINTLAS